MPAQDTAKLSAAEQSVLEKRAEKLAKSTDHNTSADTTHWLTFCIAQQTFAIDIAYVRCTGQYTNATPLQLYNGMFNAVIAWHGQIVGLLDAGQSLSAAAALPFDTQGTALLLGQEQILCALPVTRLLDVVSICADDAQLCWFERRQAQNSLVLGRFNTTTLLNGLTLIQQVEHQLKHCGEHYNEQKS